MKYYFTGSSLFCLESSFSKLLVVMKLTVFILLAVCVQVSAKVEAQDVTFSKKNITIEKALSEITTQTDYKFLYNSYTLKSAEKLNVHFDHTPLREALDMLFENRALAYSIFGNIIVIREDQGDKERSVLVTPPVLQEIQGVVKDSATGNPLIGVTVKVKGGTIGTTTDANGHFNLNVPDNSVLEASFLGYTSREIPVNGRTNIEIILAPATTGLNQVVVVGYGTQQKASLTGAVSVVDVDKVREESIADGNMVKSLVGRLPGAQISYNGDPGAGAGVLIRGLGTLNNSAPLYIIDGIPTMGGLNAISPNDIASMQVLKDASAAAIYGAQAANGVIIVTTKEASRGTHIQFSTSVTANFLRKNPLPLLNTKQYGKAQWMAARNDGVDPNFGSYTYQDHQDANGNWVLDEIILPEWLDAAHTMKPANTDWQDVISRTGVSQNYYLALSSGSEKGKVLFSVNYTDNKGTTKENEFKRTTARLNSDYITLHDHLKVGENISVIHLHSTGGNHLPETGNIQSIVPVHTVDGKGWGGPVKGMSDRLNPLLSIMLNTQNHIDYVRILGSAYADVEFIKNLHFKTTFGLDGQGQWQRNIYPTYQSGFMSETETKMEQWSAYYGSWTWNNVLSYSFNINKNIISVLVGQEATKGGNVNMYGARDGYPTNDPNYVYLDVGEGNVRNDGTATYNSLNSYFGKINYSYEDRYLATAIIRRDGSSRFGKDNRYATFPSLSVGWVLSNESFMKSIPTISYLKLRYGWGQTGNQAIPDFASWAEYQAHYGDWDWPVNNGTAYDISGNDNGSLPSGYRRLQVANSNLKWETMTESNIGLDFSLFNSKLTGSFDYYLKKNTDILVMPPYIATIGPGGGQWVNGATMKNWGWEFDVSYSDKAGGIGYSISANAFHNSNRITQLPQSAVGAYPGNGFDQTILGRPFNSFYGYVSEGIFQNQREVDDAPIQPGKGVGRLKFKDTNGDGVVNSDDRTWIGVNEPVVSVGLNLALTWKNFDLNMLWRSEFGRKVNDQGTAGFEDFFGFFGGQNYGTAVLNSWSPTNTSSKIPAISLADINNEQRFSTYFVVDASYIKLGSLELGYNLPASIAKKGWADNARIYLLAQNVLTIKGFGKNPFVGYDPQLPNEDFPIPTSLTAGINLSF